jgi:hypothetical protein
MKLFKLFTASVLFLGSSLIANETDAVAENIEQIAEETAKTVVIIDNSALEVKASDDNLNAISSIVGAEKSVILTATQSENGLEVSKVEEKPTASVVLIVDGKPYKANVSEIFAEYVSQNAEENNFKITTNLSEVASLELISKPEPVVEEIVDLDELEEVEAEDLFSKQGFLTSEDCAVKGHFKDCYAESYVCGFEGCFEEIEAGEVRPVQLVLFVHDDGKYYKVKLTESLKLQEMDEGVGRNAVTISGQYDEATNTIEATEFKAPPPPKKSFFKGCL